MSDLPLRASSSKDERGEKHRQEGPQIPHPVNTHCLTSLFWMGDKRETL
jgi:hypothetical protein